MIFSGDKLHLNELVDKINRTFVTVTEVIPGTAGMTATAATADTADQPTDVSSMDVEIPFIPACAPQRLIKLSKNKSTKEKKGE